MNKVIKLFPVVSLLQIQFFCLVDGIKVKPRRPFRLTNSAGFVSSREKKNMIGKDVLGKENDTS
jgi:hypothetical protein